jgi:hypothetical protein
LAPFAHLTGEHQFLSANFEMESSMLMLERRELMRDLDVELRKTKGQAVRSPVIYRTRDEYLSDPKSKEISN